MPENDAYGNDGATMTERLADALRALLEVTEGQDAEWDSVDELRARDAIHDEARAALTEYERRKDHVEEPPHA